MTLRKRIRRRLPAITQTPGCGYSGVLAGLALVMIFLISQSGATCERQPASNLAGTGIEFSVVAEAARRLGIRYGKDRW